MLVYKYRIHLHWLWPISLAALTFGTCEIDLTPHITPIFSGVRALDTLDTICLKDQVS